MATSAAATLIHAHTQVVHAHLKVGMRLKVKACVDHILIRHLKVIFYIFVIYCKSHENTKSKINLLSAAYVSKT